MESVSNSKATFYEAVLASESSHIGRSVDDANFPDRYGAAVVAIHRPNERIRRRVGSTRLRRGDTLLLVAERGFRQEWGPHRDFLVVNRFGGPPPTATKYGPWTLLVLAVVVILAATGVYDIGTAAMGGAMALVVFKIITFTEARESVNWGVVLMIASAFGIGAAVATSGLADEIADLIVDSFGSIGDFALVFGILLATMILTELISKQCRCRPDGANRSGERGRDQPRPDRDGSGRRRGRFMQFRHADRLSDEHHGLRPRGLSVRRLLPPGTPHGSHGSGHHLGDGRAALLTVSQPAAPY